MRVVTWNIRGCLGVDGRRSVERVADVIRGCRADVVCLQEVHKWLPQSRMQNQPKLLESMLGMRCVFLPSFRIGVGGFGNAVLTRLSMHAHPLVVLPNRVERQRTALRMERRSVLSVVVEGGWGPVRVVNTHLSLEAEDRLESVAVFRDVVRADSCPVVLCGDMNAMPDSEEMWLLAGESGLVDAGADAGSATFPSDSPTTRIDFVWHSPSLDSRGIHVVESMASDHLPVVADIAAR